VENPTLPGARPPTEGGDAADPSVGLRDVPLVAPRDVPSSRIPAIDEALKFIHELQSDPHLADERLDADTIRRLQEPSTEIPHISPDERLSIKLFLADTDGSEKIYNDVRSAILERHPDGDILSHYQVKKKVAELSGVVAICEDMCANTCIAFTGPFKELDLSKVRRVSLRSGGSCLEW